MRHLSSRNPGRLVLVNHQVNNYYTSFCIMCARQRGLKVRMIQDGKLNAMVYETGKAAGSHMFKEFADRMQDLKRRGVPGSKDIMRSLWGGLGQKNKKRLNGKPNNSFECFQNREITKIVDIVTRKTLPSTFAIRPIHSSFHLHAYQSSFLL